MESIFQNFNTNTVTYAAVKLRTVQARGSATWSLFYTPWFSHCQLLLGYSPSMEAVKKNCVRMQFIVWKNVLHGGNHFCSLPLSYGEIRVLYQQFVTLSYAFYDACHISRQQRCGHLATCHLHLQIDNSLCWSQEANLHKSLWWRVGEPEDTPPG